MNKGLIVALATISIILGVLLSIVKGQHQKEAGELRELLAKQEKEIAMLRADNAYFQSQTTEIDILEKELESKRTELSILREKGDEQKEMMSAMEKQLDEVEKLQAEVDRLTSENGELSDQMEALKSSSAAEYEYYPEEDKTGKTGPGSASLETVDGATSDEGAGSDLATGSEEPVTDTGGDLSIPPDKASGKPLTFGN